MGGEQMPPMDSEEGMDNNIPMNIGNEIPQDEMNVNSEFDSNFDAGVEADEETDPKKYIQQLTGKLSQTLNSYNNENGEPDTELGKYVLGMLVKQGTKGMDEKDRKEIIKKINTNNTIESDDDSEIPNDDIDGEVENNNLEDNIQMESKKIRCTKKQLFESFGIAMDDENKISSEKKEPDTKIQNDTVKNRRTLPFEAPKKFRN
jgi:hypothetical protein